MKFYQINKYVRVILLTLCISYPLLLSAQSSLNPDDIWIDQSGKDWYTNGLGTAFYNYNGVIYAFNYQSDGYLQGGHAYMYNINKDHDPSSAKQMADYNVGYGYDYTNRIEWGYPGESGHNNEGHPLGRVFAFQFNSRLWYFQHIRSAHQLDHQWEPDNESYECYAQLPLDTMDNCFTYYSTHKPVHNQLKMGAFQLDSMLYFVSRYSDGSQQWMIQEFSYSISDNKFHYVKNIMLPQIPTYYSMLGGLVKRLDTNGNEYMIMNMFDLPGAGMKAICKLSPGIGSDGTRTFTSTLLFEGVEIYPTVTIATTIAEGTMKACRESDPMPQSPDRLVFFGINKLPSANGYKKISFREFYFENDIMIPGTYGEINPPGSSAPIDISQIFATFELQPRQYGTYIDTLNGYEQYIWLMYPNHDKHFTGLIFKSDQWKMTGLPVESGDLTNNTKYPGIESLWTMLGICDGGPPVSIDWDLWNQYHSVVIDPTKLAFTLSSSGETKITSSYEDQWSKGESMELGLDSKYLSGSLSEEYKYANAYKNTIARDHTIKQSLEQTFALMEENQDSGRYVYAVPTIRRYPYSAYPWWDNNNTIEIPNSNNYLFRVVAQAIFVKKVPLADFPFSVNDANNDSLYYWKPDQRDDMRKAIFENDLLPIITATWTSGDEGQVYPYEITNNTSESWEQTTEYEVNVSTGVSVPSVFQSSISTSYKVNYTNETEITNSFGTEIECDLTNLKTHQTGPNTRFLSLSVYWFNNPLTHDWWYWDSLESQKPWYIAYYVNDEYESIKLISPQNKSLTEEEDLFFTWEIEGGNLYDVELIISKATPIDKYNLVYQESIGNRIGMMPSEFNPESGKTYYWIIKGTTDEQHQVCSNIYSFTMNGAAEEEQTSASSLNAMVYPNPCKSGEINIVIDAKDEGNISVSLINVNGVMVMRKESMYSDGSPMNIIFPDKNLPTGIYFAVISSEKEQLVKKVIVK